MAGYRDLPEQTFEPPDQLGLVVRRPGTGPRVGVLGGDDDLLYLQGLYVAGRLAPDCLRQSREFSAWLSKAQHQPELSYITAVGTRHPRVTRHDKAKPRFGLPTQSHLVYRRQHERHRPEKGSGPETVAGQAKTDSKAV